MLESDSTRRSSFAWKGLSIAIFKLENGFFKRPGMSSQIQIHFNNWGGSKPLHLYGDYEVNEEVPPRAGFFMLSNLPRWDESKVRDYFSHEDANKIFNVPIINDTKDTTLWGHHDSSIYSVRSDYQFQQLQLGPVNRPSRLWNILSKLPMLPKVRSLGWRLSQDVLPSGHKILQANLGTGVYPICNTDIETTLHALRDCPCAMEDLHLAGFLCRIFSNTSISPHQWLSKLTGFLSLHQFSFLITSLWNLWNRRNDFVYNHHR